MALAPSQPGSPVKASPAAQRKKASSSRGHLVRGGRRAASRQVGHGWPGHPVRHRGSRRSRGRPAAEPRPSPYAVGSSGQSASGLGDHGCSEGPTSVPAPQRAAPVSPPSGRRRAAFGRPSAGSRARRELRRSLPLPGGNGMDPIKKSFSRGVSVVRERARVSTVFFANARGSGARVLVFDMWVADVGRTYRVRRAVASQEVGAGG